MLTELTVTPAAVEVRFPITEKGHSYMRPLYDIPDLMLQDIYGGLQAMTDKRLTYGYFISDGCCCAIGAGFLHGMAAKTGLDFESLLRTVPMVEHDAVPWGTANWCAVSGRLNYRFGSPLNMEDVDYDAASHPTVQKARYAYVLGVVTSEMILRGLI